MTQINAERVLIHAPYGRDAAMIAQVLERAGIQSLVCDTPESLCQECGEHIDVALISDQMLTAAHVAALAQMLQAQPPWSDLPILVTTSGGEPTEASRRRLSMLEPLGNVTLIERPVWTATLVSAVRSGLRARHRQYQLREHLRERDRLLRDLERSNAELAQFAHVVSHDLQAPVRLVNGFSQLLVRRYQDQLDSTAHEYISTIQYGAAMMEELIRTLLRYATVGQEPITREPVEMDRVLETVMTALHSFTEESQAEITCGELPVVQGDRVLLQQLIQNLIGNALKYRKAEEPPRIRIAAERRGGQWLLSVADNGQGIAPQYHERIFAPLRRLHGGDVPGTGMGLAVCRKIVECHGGSIWVESESGKGATFYFTLPA